MKKFFEIVLVAFAVVLFNTAAFASQGTMDLKPSQGNKTLVGWVHDGDEPIAGAVVSDGYTVAVTDGNGVYEMAASDSARFVFVSVPADCEIPMADGYPAIYKEINKGKSKWVRRDFELKKTGVKNDFTFLAIADVQISNSYELNCLRTEVIGDLCDNVKSLSGPVYGVTLGDNVWDNMPFFPKFKDEMKKTGIPLFAVIGNHDHNKGVTDDDSKADKNYKDNLGPNYYSFNIGQCHFVMLDDIYYFGRKNYFSWITPAQLAWLKKDLAHVSKDKLIFVGFHIPSVRRSSKGHVKNNQELYDILRGYKVQIVSGHIHNNSEVTINRDIDEKNFAALMGAMWSGELCNDGSPRGFGVFEIRGNQIKNFYYKGLKTGREQQMSVYGPWEAVDESHGEDILINIYFWHTTWKVEVQEDGGSWTTLTKNVEAADCAAYNYMAGPDKPAYRPGVEPALHSDHFFYYTPKSKNWKTFTVKATDAYGNVYTSSLENR